MAPTFEGGGVNESAPSLPSRGLPWPVASHSSETRNAAAYAGSLPSGTPREPFSWLKYVGTVQPCAVAAAVASAKPANSRALFNLSPRADMPNIMYDDTMH